LGVVHLGRAWWQHNNGCQKGTDETLNLQPLNPSIPFTNPLLSFAPPDLKHPLFMFSRVNPLHPPHPWAIFSTFAL